MLSFTPLQQRRTRSASFRRALEVSTIFPQLLMQVIFVVNVGYSVIINSLRTLAVLHQFALTSNFIFFNTVIVVVRRLTNIGLDEMQKRHARKCKDREKFRNSFSIRLEIL